MLTFYKNSDTSFSSRVEQKLQDMVVAHNVVELSDSKSLPKNIYRKDLPVLSDGHQEWKQQEEIEDYLAKLDREISESRSLQSDACHIDPDNPEQCL